MEQTKDYSLVRRILTNRAIYELMGDDCLPHVKHFTVNTHPQIRYVVCKAGEIPFGLFCLFPENTVCWQLHVAMLPFATTKQKWAAARELIPWLRSNTECERVTAAVPAMYKKAIAYGTHGIGMRYVGRHEKAFKKHGQLEDLVLLGIPVNGGLDCRH